MVPTLTLPRGVTVDDAADRCRLALEELEALEPTRYALAHWLSTAYRNALVVGPCWPFTLRTSSPVEAAIKDAKRQLAETRVAARTIDDDFVARLPQRVHIVRLRDEHGDHGLGPIDVRGASLAVRGLSLFLADYLMRPEWYVDSTAA
jgi:hypothetical protein